MGQVSRLTGVFVGYCTHAVLGLVVALSVLACATLYKAPPASPAEEAAARAMQPPAGNNGAVYVARIGVYGGPQLNTALEVSIAGQVVGVIGPVQILRVVLPAGQYPVSVKLIESGESPVERSMSVVVQAGKNHFLLFNQESDGSDPSEPPLGQVHFDDSYRTRLEHYEIARASFTAAAAEGAQASPTAAPLPAASDSSGAPVNPM